MNDYPDNNPKTAEGAKKTPMNLCPPALTAGAAEAFANGAAKYGPYNWREKKISASVYYAAALRHLKDWWDRVDADDCAPDSGVHHIKHSAACHGMILDVMGSDLFNDDRPPKVLRYGNDPRGESEGSSKEGPQDPRSVLAHASAKRNGESKPGLPCVSARSYNPRNGGDSSGTICRGRDKSSGKNYDSSTTQHSGGDQTGRRVGVFDRRQYL